MKTPILTRLFTGSYGTFGRLVLLGKAWWLLERPQTGEHPAIPAATYDLSLGTHHAGQPDAYPCYWVQNVPGRTAIEIHVANTYDELEGCLAPGEAIMWFALKQLVGVSGSGDAFKDFMATMDGDTGQLTINEQF